MTQAQRAYKAISSIRRAGDREYLAYVREYGNNDTADMMADATDRECRQELNIRAYLLWDEDYDKLANWFMI